MLLQTPQSRLLRYPGVGLDVDAIYPSYHEFALYDQTVVHRLNFRNTLWECFTIHGVDPLVLEEALEAKVYELASKEPQAFPELFGTGSA